MSLGVTPEAYYGGATMEPLAPTTTPVQAVPVQSVQAVPVQYQQQGGDTTLLLGFFALGVVALAITAIAAFVLRRK